MLSQHVRPAELKTIAIYHASFQIVKRSAGRSVVAAIAYRSGERLVDERTGEIHDYTRKQGVDETFIMAPDDAPDWATDRTKLWSAVELGEKRKDAQLARELNVALPLELSQSESKELLEDYVQRSFIDKGMIADVAMHDMNSENPHAHVVLTMREVNFDGFGLKNTDWNSKILLQEWREEWAQKTNQHLERAGHDERIDHRSFEEQGIDKAPTIHMGVHASAMEKRGVKTERGDRNRALTQINQIYSQIKSTVGSAIVQTKQSLGKHEETIKKALAGKPSELAADVAKLLENQVRERERQQQLKMDAAEKQKPRRSITRGDHGLGH